MTEPEKLARELYQRHREMALQFKVVLGEFDALPEFVKKAWRIEARKEVSDEPNR